MTNNISGNTAVGKAVVDPAAETAMAGTGPDPAAGAEDFKGATAVALTRPARPTAMSATTEPCQGSWMEFSVKTPAEWTALSDAAIKGYSNGMMATIRIRLVFAMDYSAGGTTKFDSNQ